MSRPRARPRLPWVATLAGACASGPAPESPGPSTAAQLPDKAPIIVEVPPPEPEPEPSVLEPVPTPRPTGGDWTTFHGGPERRGRTDAPAVEHPHLRWKAMVGIQSWLNSPIASDGTVYVPTCGKAHNTSDPGDGVYALRLDTGAQLWHAHTGNDANGAALDAGRIFVTSDDGSVRSLDAATGKEIWRDSARGKVYSSPLVMGDHVLVGDARGYVRALRTADGKEAWKRQFVGPIRGGVASDGGHVFVASQGGDVAALTPEGKVVWRKTVTRPPWGGRGHEEPIEIYPTPILTDALVILGFARDTYYSELPALIALSKVDGRERWRGKGPDDWGNIRSTPALHDHTLVYSEPYSGDVVGIDVRHGTTRYRRTIDTCYFPQWASPAVAGDTVYLPRFGGTLFALDARDGSVTWSVYLGESRAAGGATPSELRSDGCSWDLPKGWPLYSPVAVAPDGTVLAGSEEGYLYAIEEAPTRRR